MSGEKEDQGIWVFPRGDSLIESYYRWLATKEYIDPKEYANGKPEGRICLTESGMEHMRGKQNLRMMAEKGYIDRDKFYKKGEVVLTPDGKKYLNEERAKAKEDIRDIVRSMEEAIGRIFQDRVFFVVHGSGYEVKEVQSHKVVA